MVSDVMIVCRSTINMINFCFVYVVCNLCFYHFQGCRTQQTEQDGGPECGHCVWTNVDAAF